MPSTLQIIGNYAFYYNLNLQTVNLNEGLIKIGGSAFNNCTSLTSITMPSTLQKIGNDAFYYNENLQTVNLNEGLIEIGGSAFRNCTSLTSIIIPSSVTTIGSYALRNTGLTSIVNHAPVNWNWYTITRSGSSVTCEYTTDTCTYGGITVTNDIAS